MKRFLPVFIAVVSIVLGRVAFGVVQRYVDNRYVAFSDPCELYVYPGTTAAEVQDTILSRCTLRFPGSIRRSFAKENVAADIKPGHYVIEAGKPAVYAARMLTHGWQTPVDLVLSGTIRSKDKIARLISAQMMVDSLTVANALNDSEFLSAYGFNARTVFGLILPDTYRMYWTDGIDRIFARFRSEYDAFWNEERRAKAAKIGLTPFQTSIMASIVQGETLAEMEFRRIAGVYMNRYRKGMKLQADPTVCYVFDYKLDRVLRKHLEVDSPYNTYRYAGLPPTPINVPGKKYIDAVLNYEHHDYIFFCADPSFNGTHRFAVTYSDHLKNAREFSKALTERNRKRAKS